MQKVLVIDLSCFFIRRLHSAAMDSPLSEEAVCQSVSRLINQYGTDAVVICVSESDKPAEIWQSQLWEVYRRKLDSLSPEQREFMVATTSMVRDMGLPVLADPRFESDDLAAGLVGAFSDIPDTSITLISNDPELCALLPGRALTIVEPFGGRRDMSWVKRKYGVEAGQLPDYFALSGNGRHPGLKGIGPVRARELVCEFGCLEGMQHTEKQGRGAQSVRDSFYEACIFKVLSTPRHDLFRGGLSGNV